MRPRFSRPLLLLFLFLAALLATAAFVLLFPDRLLQSIQPWLERVASDRLDARVSYRSLQVGRGWVAVEALRLERDGTLQVEAARLTARWSLAGLLARRLEAVTVEHPAVFIRLADEPRAPLASAPPLKIDQLTLTGGRFQVAAGDRTFRLGDLAVSGALSARAPFRLTARAGAGAGLSLQAAGVFVWGEPPAVTLTELVWEGQPLLASPLTVRLPTAGTAAEGTLQLERFDDRQLETLLAAFQLSSPLPEDWGFSLTQPQVGLRLVAGEVTLRLKAPEATVTGAGMALPLQQIEGEVRGEGAKWGLSARYFLAEAPGRLQGEWSGGRAEGTVALSIVDPAAFKQRLLGGDFASLAGGFDLAAGFTLAAGGEMRLQATLDGRTGRRPAAFLFDLGPLSARLELHRPAGGEFAGHAGVVAGGREFLRLRGTAQRLEIELPPTAGRDLIALLPPERRPALAAGLEAVAGSATLVRDRQGGWRGDTEVRAAALPIAGGTLRQFALAGSLVVRNGAVGFEQLRFSGTWGGEGMTARIAAAGDGRWQGGEGRLRLQKLALREIDYLSADGLTGLSGGRLEAAGTVVGRPGGDLRLELAGEIGARELLHEAFYADLIDRPASFTLRGRLPGGSFLEAEALALTVPGVGAARLQGNVGSEQVALHALLEIPDLAALHAGPLGQALITLRPVLADLRPAGGAVLEGEVRRQQRHWAGSGELRLNGLSLDWPALQVTGRRLDGSLPWFFGKGEAAREGEGRRGRLEFDELHLGPASLTRRPLLLSASPESFAIETPLHFALAGGDLRIEEATLAWGETPEMSARLLVRQADLGELTRRLELPPMAGRISADLGRIRLRGDAIQTDGALGINAFDGDILVRNLRLESIFSRYRTLQADVEFTGIDLFQLTRTFEFGEINGVADGYVHGLRLFGTVPSAFEARLETRERGRRNISVKALNNISVLSQGGFAAVLSRGIYRFIDFYRYRKIGVYCSLKNDLFVLRGTARPGSDDYLVDGGLLPPKINIIAPTRTVSFKEMLKRLQRLERSGPPPNTP